ncbi:MAG: nickel/cobalt efflux transporter RcnA [Pseudomonas sp.]|nr:nickel/cobalt efflux transporter RcnA [Pseudomonas sp.]
MLPIAELLQQGSSNAWLFIPSAILLGALHGLEPGHSKTMMASFIIAIRGSVAQAILLGLCAALSHSLIVWLLAAVALKFGNELIAEQAEPYFMLLSALIVAAVALWMFWRTRKDNLAATMQEQAPHGGKLINTGHGLLEVSIYEDGVPPHFRLYRYDAQMQPLPIAAEEHLEVAILRPDNSRETFSLQAADGYLASTTPIAEPHEFMLHLSLGHQDHQHHFTLQFSEAQHEHHHHDHDHAAHSHTSDTRGDYQDAHQRAHTAEIEKRFAGRQVSNGQIALFGLSGGLVPCPASVTILLICLHLKQFSLGAALVASFSLGLAIALVGVGVIAAWSARQASQRFTGLSHLARKMPYLSSALMLLVSAVMGIQGWLHLSL